MKFPTRFATVLLLQAAFLHNALYAYAFVEEFNLPAQGTTPGWQIQSGTADVVSGVNGANGTALRLNAAGMNQDEASVIRPIPWDSNESIAFIDFLIKPAANAAGSLASILVNGTQVAFQVPASSNQGEIWALHGNDDHANTEGQWLKTPGSYTTDSSNQATAFVRVTLRQDYGSKVWDLFIDGKMASANLGFEGRGANLTQIEFYGSFVADTTIDQLQADPSNLLFPDADKDGLPDAWETSKGSNPNAYDRNSINPSTGRSYLEDYVNSLWSNSTTPNGNGVVTVSSASIPSLSIGLPQHQPVGALKGAMSVGGDGSSSYSIPIDIPKGTGGMEPKLSLNYSSNGGNGLLGVGWSLGGLQKITRGPSSVLKDGVADIVDFDSHDRFFLDGERLICVAGTYGSPGSEYRTEMDAFSRITLNGTAPGNLWWKLETKAGLIVELGTTEDSVELVNVPTNPPTTGILSWSVNKVSDTVGNYYTLQYDRDPSLNGTNPDGYTLRNFRLASVAYTGRTPNVEPYCSINFLYDDRPDQGRAYTRYAGYLVSKRLSKILVKTGSYTNHSYVLAYNESNQSKRSFLSSVEKWANGQSTLKVPATTFNYDGLSSGQNLWQAAPASQWQVYGVNVDATGSVNNSTIAASADGTSVTLDGDVSRVYALPGGGVMLYPDSVMTFEFQGQSLSSGAFIGLDTDSVLDLYPSRLYRLGGSGTVLIPYVTGYPYNPNPPPWQTYMLQVGQNATGLHTHLALMCNDDSANGGIASATFRNVRIYRSGTQTAASVSPISFSTKWELPRFQSSTGQDLGVRFMDLNSDGRPELCDWRATGYNGTGNLLPQTMGQVYRNTGSGFVADSALCPPVSMPLGFRKDDAFAYNYDRKHHVIARPIDINSDGRVDLLCSDGLNFTGGSLTNGLRFYTQVSGAWQELGAYQLPFLLKNLSSTAPYGGVQRDHHCEWVDIDGDGYTDLVYHTTSYGKLVDRLNPNTILLGPNSTTAWLNRIHLGQGWIQANAVGIPVPLRQTYPSDADMGRRLADLDGDGHPEVAEAISAGVSQIRHSYKMQIAENGTVTGWTTAAGNESPPPDSNLDLPGVSDLGTTPAFVNTNPDPIGTQLMDLNGDGLTDIIRSSRAGGQTVRGIYLNHGQSQASRWTLEPQAPAGNASAQRTTYDLPGPLHWLISNQYYPAGYEMTDINGDGLVDVLLAQNTGSDEFNRVYMNSGAGWVDRGPGLPGNSNAWGWGMPEGLRISKNDDDTTNGRRRAMLQDLNGDGFPDLITGLIGETPKIYMNQCSREVLTSVTDGFGSTLSVEYKRLNDPTPIEGTSNPTYQPGPDSLPNGQNGVQDSRLVVARLTESDGRGGFNSTRRHYGDLRFDRINEASLGFGWMEVYDETMPALKEDGTPNSECKIRGYSRTETSRTYPNAGSPIVTRSYVNVPATNEGLLPGVSLGIRLVSEETSTYGELTYFRGVGGTVRRPVQTGSFSRKWDLNGVQMGETTTYQTFDAPLLLETTWNWTPTGLQPAPVTPSVLNVYGFATSSTILALDGSLTVTTNNYTHTTTGGKWHLGRLSGSSVTKTQPGTSPIAKSSLFTYDADSGLIETETVQPGQYLSVTTAYTRDGFGNITSKAITGSGSTRTSSTVYDTRGRFPIAETNDLGTVSTAYDPDRALVTATTDLDGFVTTYEYDAFGTKIRTNLPDGTASAEITQYATNASLPAAVASQIGTSIVKYTKLAQASGTPVAQVWYDALGREIAASSKTLTSFNGNSGTWTDVYSVNQYDFKGRKYQSSEPFASGETPRWTKLLYDPLDRVIATEHPDGTTDRVVTIEALPNGGANPLLYTKIQNRSGGSESWDEQYLERWENQHGRLVHSKDESGQDTYFTHDAEGRVKTVTVGGVLVLSNTWDRFGNKTAVTDADAGSSSSEYNAFGEITKTTNALGQETSMAYDNLGRVTSVTKPEGLWTTTYRGSSPAKGKPATVSGPGQSDSFSYDAYGRVTSTTSVRGGETFVTRSTYDALGRVSTATDAGGLTIVNDYDGAYSTKVRVRTSLQGKSETLWQARTFDSSGRPTQQITAHGVVVDQTFQATNGKLLGIHSKRVVKDPITSAETTTNLQDLSYTWDAKTNLKSRTDSLAGTSETFTYDKLNRLTSATLGSSVSNYTYAANGNLLSKPFLSAVTYGGSRPHAITAATVRGVVRSYTYDAAGRVTSDGERSYQWTSFGQLQEVTQLSTPLLKTFDATQRYSNQGLPGIPSAQQYQASIGTSTFEFDASGSRWKQDLLRTYVGGGTARLTTLYLGAYERETLKTQATSGATPVLQKTLHRHQLGTAIYTIEEKPNVSPVVKLSALLNDHLGSTDVILAATWNGTAWDGFQAERQSFDPWGERRDPDTWTTQRTQGSDPRVTSGADYHRGFTGHEMLDDFGLIHMNGRIYDPEIGRFLSCDPYVQVPEFSQNFNRYTYVLNNPLTFTDPSGHAINGIWNRIICLVVEVVLDYFNVPAPISSAITSALSVALSGGKGSDIVKAGITAYIQGCVGVQASSYGPLVQAGATAVAAGTSNEVMGGKFEDGFIDSLEQQAIQGAAKSIAHMWTSYNNQTNINGVGNVSREEHKMLFNAGYQASEQRSNGRIDPRALSLPEGWKFERFYRNYEESNLDYAIFINPSRRIRLQSFVGSEINNGFLKGDWGDNFIQGFGLRSKQYIAAIREGLFQQSIANRRGYSLVLNGHSLGGGLASAAAAVTGAPTAIFNSAGLNPMTLRYAGFADAIPRMGQNVVHYGVGGEILSGAEFVTFFAPAPAASNFYSWAPSIRRPGQIFPWSWHGSEVTTRSIN